MKLSKERLEAALMPRLNRCPNCGTDKHWIIDDEVMPLLHHNLEGNNISMNVKNPTYVPLVLLTCPECGYTEFFNVKVLGLV